MADDKKKSYPKIPRANWFSLRDRFRQKPPSEVTVSYLSSALGIAEPSAANLIPPLKALGLVGKDNKLTDLAFEWRDDATYAGACEKMLESTYPTEVRELYHDSSATLRDVAGWFSKHLRIGESAANNIASLYLLLLEQNPKGKENAAKPKATGAPAKAAPRARAAPPSLKETARVGRKPDNTADSGQGGDGEKGQGQPRGFSPKLHVDIQIHISPDSTAEQIDKIFESMAKYLPLKG
ncbi:DUF5343 domain-containing protein [Pseudoxanthomonas sp. LjRoot143]|uniref:DUF5343 domain-containing protein n=1 Tax=Pseudoxanthomonas sp. LjRoot143 TaxID=3342266 RepID=UPI003ECCD721